MAEFVNTAPAFEVILSAEARPHRKSVALLFGTADRKKFGIEFSAAVVPATITALASLLGQVVSSLPEEERPNPQVLRTTGMTLAMNEQGGMGLVLSFEGGGELTLAMPTSDLPKLRDQILEAIEASDRDHRN
ncbi:MAG: hypothetical protein ACYC0C_15915 [Devosia sp.]